MQDHPDSEQFTELEPFLTQVKARVPLPLLVLVRWSQAAGAKDYLCFGDFDSLRQFCEAASPSTNILVFTDPPDPLSGVCDPDLVSQAANLPPTDRREWLVVNHEPAPEWSSHERSRTPDLSPLESRQRLRSLIATHMACKHEHELKEAASDLAGNQVAIYPFLPLRNTDPFIEVFIDGKPGVY